MAFNYSPKVVTDSLVLYLDAANPKSYVSGSTTWGDLSRGGNNGTLVNGPTFDGGNGGSIVFDGVNDYGTVPTNPLLITTEFTKSIWFNIISLPVDTNIREVFRQSGLYFLISYRADLNPKLWQIGFTDSTSAKYWQPSTLPLNTWQNITLTGNGSNFGIYYNSTLQASGTYSGIFSSGTGDIFISSFTSTSRFINSKIGLIKYYNRALSATEVLQNYNATKTRFGL